MSTNLGTIKSPKRFERFISENGRYLEKPGLFIGAVSITGSEHCEPAKLLTAADELLYRAKHEGRNRVIWQRLPATQEAVG